MVKGRGRGAGRERRRLRFQWTERVNRGNEFFFSPEERSGERSTNRIMYNCITRSFLRSVLLLGSSTRSPSNVVSDY